MCSSGVTAGDVSYPDVKFHADFESASISCVRCLVFVLSWKESARAIISRQKSPFWAFFWCKTSALRKSTEIGQNTTAPRERAQKSTSRGAEPEGDNARRHGFVGTKTGKNGRFGPIRADLARFWRHGDCDSSATTGRMPAKLLEQS